MADIYVKIAGIEGESQDAVHAGAIEAHAWRWSVEQSSSAICSGNDKTANGMVSDVVFTHSIDRASPNLAVYCWRGQFIPEVKIICRKAGGTPHEFLLYTLTGAMIVRCSTAGGSGGGSIEEVAIRFNKMKMEYVLQNALGGKAGTVTGVIDLRR